MPTFELAVIAPRSFFGALSPFVAAGRAAGWSVDLIDLEDVYDEMNFGEPSALAITRWVKVRPVCPSTLTEIDPGGAHVN